MNGPTAEHEIEGARASEWGLVVQLRTTAREIVMPWTFTQRLAHASHEDREAFRVIGTHHLRWDALDEDIHVDDLYAWAKAQEDGSLPFFAAGTTETHAMTTDLDGYRSIGTLCPEPVQSGTSAEVVEGSAGAADMYLDQESWDVLRDILDELRLDDPAGVAAFELAVAQATPHHAPRADALRDALIEEKAEQLTLENAGRLTQALARALGIESGVTLLARVIVSAVCDEPPQLHDAIHAPEETDEP